MDQDIKITGEPLDSERCKFIVDRPVYPGGSVRFASKEEAKGSPLAERLFEIEHVVGVLVSENVVTVTKNADDDWVPIGKNVGAAIRAQLQSGVPAISEAVRVTIPPASEIREKIQHLLDTEINPAVAMHGGHVHLIDVQGNVVYIQMGGGCQGCGMADVTLKQGIEMMIREVVPEVGEILDVTDHAAGRNPYYTPSK
ncbi:MAG: NifU family protein [candidate division NC10 bacterium]|nr:NifU family protein [candidate division NC10 bacterium]